MLKLFSPEIVFFFIFLQLNFAFSSLRFTPSRTRIVCLSCLLHHLSMNEIIISHEKFSSENKNIIGTSIFIMGRKENLPE